MKIRIELSNVYVTKFHENLLRFSRLLDRLTCSHIPYTTFWVNACARNEMPAGYERAHL